MSYNNGVLAVKNGVGYAFIKGFKNFYGFTVTTNEYKPINDMPVLERFDGERQLSEWSSLIGCLKYIQPRSLFSEITIMTNLENIQSELDGTKKANETAALCIEASKLIEEIREKGYKINVFWIPKSAERKFNEKIRNGEIPGWLNNPKFRELLESLSADLSAYRARTKLKP